MKRGSDADVRIEGFTEKEVDKIIRRKRRSIDRMKDKIIDLKYAISAEIKMLDLWKDLKRKFSRKRKGK